MSENLRAPALNATPSNKWRSDDYCARNECLSPALSTPLLHSVFLQISAPFREHAHQSREPECESAPPNRHAGRHHAGATKSANSGKNGYSRVGFVARPRGENRARQSSHNDSPMTANRTRWLGVPAAAGASSTPSASAREPDTIGTHDGHILFPARCALPSVWLQDCMCAILV